MERIFRKKNVLKLPDYYQRTNYLFSISHMFDINEYGIYDIR